MTFFTETIQRRIFYIATPIILFLAGSFLTTNNPSFMGMAPHPYLVTSILLSAYYGLRFSIVISFILTIQYLFLLNQSVDYQAVETILTFQYLSIPITLVILSTLIGEFRTSLINKLEMFKSSSEEKQNLTDTLIKKVDFLDKESFELKKQLVNKIDTTSNIFRMIQQLNTLESSSLFQNFFNVLNDQISVDEMAIYKYDKGTHSLILAFSSRSDLSLPSNLNCTYIEDPIIRECFVSKKLTTIKDIFNQKKALDNNVSVIASPVYQSEEFFGIIAVTKMPFLEYTPHNFQLIQLYGQWLGKSLEHASEFDQLNSNSIFNQTYGIYTYNYLLERIDEIIDQNKRNPNPLAAMSINVPFLDKLNPIQQKDIKKLITKIILSSTRKMDVVAESNQNNSFIVLTTIGKSEYLQKVGSRIEAELEFFSQSGKLKELFKTQISYLDYSEEETSQEFLNKFGDTAWS